MSIWKALEKTAEAAGNVLLTPVDVAADVVTMGGATTEKDRPYTVKRAERVADLLEEAYDETHKD